MPMPYDVSPEQVGEKSRSTPVACSQKAVREI
jgi:hypothetical protein